MSQRRRTAAVLVSAAAVVLGPVLLAGPAFASGTLPDEPPGGATCAPDAPATDCQQEPPADPAPSATPTKAANPTTLPTTGGSKPVSRPALAHTGTAGLGYGVAGGVLLLAGSALVVAGRRTARA